MIWVFAIALGINTAVLLHVYALYPLSLALLRRVATTTKTAPGPASELPDMAIVFCAYNEAESIDAKIDNLLSIKREHRNIELLVYADGCTDGTLEKLQRHEREIRVFSDEHRRGKSHGMNTLVQAARAGIVISTDANVMLDTDAPRRVARYFADPSVGVVCGHLIYTNVGESPTATVGSAYWRFEELIKRLESDTGSTMGADGSLFAYRRELFREVPLDIIDDMYTSLSILCDGYAVKRAEDFVAYESSATRSKEEFARKVRISCRAFNAHRLLWPRLRRLPALDLYKYVSHKLLRWFTILFVAGWIVSLLGLLTTLGHGLPALLATAAVSLLLGLGYLLRVRVLSMLVEVLLAFTATGWGLVQSLRGKRFQTWDIAATSRGRA